MNLRPIPPPISACSEGAFVGYKILKAWTDDEYVFYLTLRFQYAALWYCGIEKGIGGRIIQPIFKTWDELYLGTSTLGYVFECNEKIDYWPTTEDVGLSRIEEFRNDPGNTVKLPHFHFDNYVWG